MNKVALTGRITKDIELRKTTSGISVVQFTLAINRTFKNKDGEYETDFPNCVAYNHSANILKEYAKKGDLIGVEGRIQTRTYQNKEGKNVYLTEIAVERVEFLQPKQQNGQQSGQVVNTAKEIFNDAVEETDPYEEFAKQNNAELEDISLDLPF